MNTFKKIIAYITFGLSVFSAIYLSIDTNSAEKAEYSGKDTKIKAENALYRVKSHDGRIAVFIEGESTPIHTLDSPYIRDLPEYDQQLLKAGIVAETNEALLKILEDYDN